MKIILLTILLFSNLTNDNSIHQIEQECQNINQSINNYRKVYLPDINVYSDINPKNYSNESIGISGLAIINLTRYYDSSEVKKAVVQFIGDREDLSSEYYFKNNSLMFVLKYRKYYESPKWSENFDTDKYSIKIDKYYFERDSLIHWQGQPIDSSIAEEKLVRDILDDSKLYKNY